MSADHSLTELSLRGNCIAIRHSQVRHPVQRCTPHKHLRGLSLKAARTDSLAKDRLHSKDLRLSQRAAMITALSFPCLSPFLSDRSQILVTGMPFRFGIPMLPNLRSLLRRDGCSRNDPCPDGATGDRDAENGPGRPACGESCEPILAWSTVPGGARRSA